MENILQLTAQGCISALTLKLDKDTRKLLINISYYENRNKNDKILVDKECIK